MELTARNVLGVARHVTGNDCLEYYLPLSRVECDQHYIKTCCFCSE